MYDYRKMTPEQRHEAVQYRRLRERPWHSPPHWKFVGQRQFIISAACYEHSPIIGATHERMTEWEAALLDICGEFATTIYAWCVLPNHYHLLVRTDGIEELRGNLGNSMVAPHSSGTARINAEGDTPGTGAWIARSDRMVISGRA